MSLPVQSRQQREQEVTWVLRTRGGRKNSVLQIEFVRILTREFGFVFDVYTAVTQCYITQWIGLLGLCAQRPAWVADSEPAAQRNMHPRWLTLETLLMSESLCDLFWVALGDLITESIQEISCVDVCHSGVWFRAVFRVLFQIDPGRGGV